MGTKKQTEVTYRIAEGADDLRAIHDLMRQENFIDQDVTFPTVMAMENGKLVGFMATSPSDEMVIAGPLLLDTSKSRPFTALRLMGLYDTVMRNLNIKSYIFNIDVEDSGLTRGIRKYFKELKPYASDGKHEFYVRHL
jgi:hypothetical protein